MCVAFPLSEVRLSETKNMQFSCYISLLSLNTILTFSPETKCRYT